MSRGWIDKVLRDPLPTWPYGHPLKQKENQSSQRKRKLFTGQQYSKTYDSILFTVWFWFFEKGRCHERSWPGGELTTVSQASQFYLCDIMTSVVSSVTTWPYFQTPLCYSQFNCKIFEGLVILFENLLFDHLCEKDLFFYQQLCRLKFIQYIIDTWILSHFGLDFAFCRLPSLRNRALFYFNLIMLKTSHNAMLHRNSKKTLSQNLICCSSLSAQTVLGGW